MGKEINDYRLNPFTDSVDAVAVMGEIVTIPSTTPYRTRLVEIPQKSSPSTMSARIVDTLAAAITSTSAVTITVINGSWHVLNEVITIDAEQMQVTGISSNVLTVTRGYNSTVASTHLIGTRVYIENSMIEVSSTPSSGQFWPDYLCQVTDDTKWNTGLILFSSNDAGKNVAFNYMGLGTLVDKRALAHGILLFEASGSFVVPEGITAVWITICGAGGGGNYNSGSAISFGGGVLSEKNFSDSE